MKTIRLVNANLGKAGTVETDVETWGELQTLEDVKDYMSGDVQAVVRESQNILDLDQAELPTEKLADDEKNYDFSLFFVTKDSKAGADKYDDMGFNELRSECSKRDSIEGDRGNYGSSTDMREKLREDDTQNQSSPCNVDDDFKSQVVSLLSSIDQKLSGNSPTQVTQDEDQEPAGPTEDEKKEFDSISSQLGG